MNLRPSKGIYLACLTALISGFSIFLNKFALSSFQDPLIFTTLKNLGVGLFIVSLLFTVRQWPQIKRLTRKETVYLFLIGLIGGSLPFYLFFTGLSQVPAVNAALIQKTLVFWVILLAVPFLKEKLTKLQILAVLLLFTGNLVIGGFHSFSFSRGELSIFLSTIFWAVEYVLAKKLLATVHPNIVTAARMGVGSLILLLTAAIASPAALTKTASLTPQQWLWLIVSMALLFGYVFTWYRALKFSSAITVTSILVSATLVTNLLSAFFLTHTLAPALIIQGVLIALGVFLFWKSARKSPKSSPQLNLQI